MPCLSSACPASPLVIRAPQLERRARQAESEALKAQTDTRKEVEQRRAPQCSSCSFLSSACIALLRFGEIFGILIVECLPWLRRAREQVEEAERAIRNAQEMAARARANEERSLTELAEREETLRRQRMQMEERARADREEAELRAHEMALQAELEAMRLHEEERLRKLEDAQRRRNAMEAIRKMKTAELNDSRAAGYPGAVPTAKGPTLHEKLADRLGGDADGMVVSRKKESHRTWRGY